MAALIFAPFASSLSQYTLSRLGVGWGGEERREGVGRGGEGGSREGGRGGGDGNEDDERKTDTLKEVGRRGWMRGRGDRKKGDVGEREED